VFGQQSVLGELVQMLEPNGPPPITGSAASSQGGYSAVQVESVQQGGKPLVLGKQVTLMIRKKERLERTTFTYMTAKRYIHSIQ